MDVLRNVLARLEREGAALGHFNVADLVLLKAVLAAAGEIRVPVIVGTSEGERDFFGTRQLAAVVNTLREESDVPVFLNADHTHSLAKQWSWIPTSPSPCLRFTETDRYSLLVRLFHPLLHAGCSENIHCVIVSDGVDSGVSLISTERPRRLRHRK
ncbi:MAG: class II fructose-bisphosphate aldolase [Candidatus Sulfotelmatobacter sp.]